MGEIELAGVTVAFDDVTAVDDVDLLVRDGELLVLVGPSGCGKTTLLRTIAGLERPTAGEVAVDGRRVTDLPARKRDVSLVFQDFALFPHLSVRENVSFDLRMQGYDDVGDRVRDVAELLEIPELLDRSIDELSGGQKQRVALGRAIVTEPTAFLLDEPLANLDASLRERMRTEIARLQNDLAVTTVHVTHDQAEALTMGDRVAVMRNGRVEQVGTPEAVYRSPASLFVAGFVGSPTMNLLRGRYDPDAGGVEVGTGRDARRVPVALSDDAGEVVLGVRPEHVVVEDRPSGGDQTGDQVRTGDAERTADGVRTGEWDGATEEDWIEATVAFDEFHGADRFVYLDAPGLPELVARTTAETEVGVGDALAVRFPPDRIHPFDAETGRRIAADDRPTPGPVDLPEGESR